MGRHIKYKTEEEKSMEENLEIKDIMKDIKNRLDEESMRSYSKKGRVRKLVLR